MHRRTQQHNIPRTVSVGALGGGKATGLGVNTGRIERRIEAIHERVEKSKHEQYNYGCIRKNRSDKWTAVGRRTDNEVCIGVIEGRVVKYA